MKESLDWMGIPWRWTFVYRRLEVRSDSYLVPLPTGPRWVLTVPVELVEHLPLKHLPRPVREGLLGATRVGGHLWPHWDVVTKGQVPEIAQLVDAILAHEPLASAT